MIRSDIARLRWAVASATAAEVDLVVDLAAEDASLALAAASLGRRTILHATDALAEWRAVFALRPPSVRAFDSAAEGLLGSIADALDVGWRGACAAGEFNRHKTKRPARASLCFGAVIRTARLGLAEAGEGDRMQ